MPDVMFYEVFREEEAALRRHMPAYVKAAYTRKTIQEDGAADCPAKVISTRTQSVIPQGWADKLSGILTRSQGYDHLLEYSGSAKVSVPCGYLEDYCSRAVAEHAVMSMLCLLRKLKKQLRQFGVFLRDGLTGAECLNRRALVIGVGRVGGQIADIVKGLKMEVRGVDVAPKREDIKYVPLEDGLKRADVVFCALPLTDDTRQLLDYGALSLVPEGCLLINVSRGEITPVNDLVRLLEEKKLGGVSLDVFEGEKKLARLLREQDAGTGLDGDAETVLKLKERDDVLFTPHNAFNTEEALERKARLSAESVVKFLNNGSFVFTVPII